MTMVKATEAAELLVMMLNSRRCNDMARYRSPKDLKVDRATSKDRLSDADLSTAGVTCPGRLMSRIIAVYDNPEFADRYTVVLDRKGWTLSAPNLNPSIGLSGNPDNPQGFSNFSECLLGDHLGRKVEFEDLPENVREHVRKRLS